MNFFSLICVCYQPSIYPSFVTGFPPACVAPVQLFKIVFGCLDFIWRRLLSLQADFDSSLCLTMHVAVFEIDNVNVYRVGRNRSRWRLVR